MIQESQSSMRLSIFVFVLIGLVAACVPAVPTVPPEINVAVTLVENQDALDTAVGQALTATADRGIYATETALADAGITVTPSPTSTVTPTPVPPTETPVRSPTPTVPPTETTVPTATALPSNTPNPNVMLSAGQVRVIHAWKSGTAGPVDVFIDDLPVMVGLEVGQATGYQQVLESSVRVRLEAQNPLPGAVGSVINELVNVPQGHVISLVVTDPGTGPSLTVIDEDTSPLSSGQTRLTFVQADPELLRVNLFDDVREITLLHDFEAGQIGGPFDLPAGNLALALADAELTDQVLSRMGTIRLDSHVNQLVVFVPADDITAFEPEMLVFSTGTQINPVDRPVRLINAAQAAGPIDIDIGGNPLVVGLAVGDATVPLPMPRQGANFTVRNSDGLELYAGLVELEDATDNQAEWLVLVSDAAESSESQVDMTVFERTARASSALANVRLIHGLTGATNTLDLEMRASAAEEIENPIGVPVALQADSDWAEAISNVSFGEASLYALRSPNVFDARVTLSGTGAVQATIQDIGLLAGGTYDFVAVPGSRIGVTQILVLEPSPQVAILAMRRDDPQLIDDRVNATLTAVAPAITETVAQAFTPTATISPVPTNTPRPSNTPRVKPIAIEVNPAPPNTVVNSFIVSGEGFTPRVRYTVSLDNGPDLVSGRVNNDGTLSSTVAVPRSLAPGAHSVRVCADCRVGGVQEAVFAVILAPDPNSTPTDTPGL